jgi:hypothetical protein
MLAFGLPTVPGLPGLSQPKAYHEVANRSSFRSASGTVQALRQQVASSLRQVCCILTERTAVNPRVNGTDVTQRNCGLSAVSVPVAITALDPKDRDKEIGGGHGRWPSARSCTTGGANYGSVLL